jgi:stage V sporulation protein D (sporulation-specific penicillin-binding protein)
MPKRTDLSYGRFVILMSAFGLMALGLLMRLFSLQILQNESFVAQAEEQHGAIRHIPASRGTIKSADGFNLAMSQPAYQIHVDPKNLVNASDAARKIIEALRTPLPNPPVLPAATSSASPLASVDAAAASLASKISDRRLRDVVVARKVEASRMQVLDSQHLKGISFTDDTKRYYPEGTLASQVLGFVGSDSTGADQGYYGIEGYFDQDLRGKDGKVYLEQDRMGNPIPIGKYVPKPMEQGATITLTLNRDMQYMAEEKLKAGVEANKAESGSVIIMEPQTGKVLALANYPTYDPLNWSDATVQKKALFKDSAISDVYEPGSVMKAFTVSTGIDLGLFGPETTYHSAPLKVADHTITTADFKYYGTATVTQMLEHSDNTGAAQFGMQIGRDRFLAAFHKIGFDHKTGITLEGEGNSIIPNVQDWQTLTVATASFGQGISVTPIQLTQMMATIANKGQEMQPTIIQSLQQGGVTKDVAPVSLGQIFSSHTTDQVVSMLQKVVLYGEFHRLALQGYRIAGKTGTAQIPENGVYNQNQTITTFLGFAPATDPKFVMLVKLNKPQINNSAETVVPVWMNIAAELFHTYGIAPEPTPTPGS